MRIRIGDVRLFYCDGPEAATELHEYVESFEDGGRLIGVYRRVPGTLAPFYDSFKWTPTVAPQPTGPDVVPTDGDEADIAGHETLHRDGPCQLKVVGSGDWTWDITSATPIHVHDMTEAEQDQYYGKTEEPKDE